jgi:hypothetical protein
LATPADLVQEACDLLSGYMGTLELLVAEPSSAQDAAVGMSPRPADTPEPWDAPVGRALMDGHEGVRRLEAVLRYALNGHPGRRRGGSEGNTREALNAIPRLAAGLTEDDEAAAARIVERWVNAARAVAAIDEAQRWRHVRGRACPYCKCLVTIKVLLDRNLQPTGYVECRSAASVRCTDANGRRPSAHIRTDARGDLVLAWDDGLVEAVPDLEEAG